ncbi:methyl-accepting chemotaxis protein [Clostridium sp. SHJSY1]|uniref:methyl-accepting chemotaxis protein n=1 Tax=Clostridium sp. SHJSY1 TaxID=2942483 RepID=UPI002876D424|nr:methyl-accepting chemotaxis protein [Clostridium sp. SHJSY1]MDS0524645.1 methyl-accepting chemotaxis protein [Clostridium sp. SHJSY1]
MSWFNNLKMGAKLNVGFALVYVVALVLGIGGALAFKNGENGSSSMIYLVVIGIGGFIAMSAFSKFVNKDVNNSMKSLADIAEKITLGDTNNNVQGTSQDQMDRLKTSLLNVVDVMENLSKDVSMLNTAVMEDNVDVRVDEVKYFGQFKNIINGINKTVNKIAEKNVWYEAIIDAVPFPIHVTDTDMNWTYMNKQFENLMIEQGTVRKREDGYGRACSNAGANICNTPNCGIKQLLKGTPESYFDWCGMSCKQDTSYLRNKKGEHLGFVEVVTDLTAILSVNEYSKKEVERLASNLDLLAKGDLNLDLEVSPADKFTEETKNNFVKINNNLEKTKVAISRLISDAVLLSDSAIAGKLEVRADAKAHEGEYRKIVEGVNGTLDTVVNKNEWYEAIIDAVPFPIHVTDTDMNWTYMNKQFEDLMIDQGTVRKREDGYGRACSNAGANICNTPNCGIKQLLKGNPESYFDWCGMSCKQDTSYLKNKKGEHLGFVEVVTDLTSILRVGSYTNAEVDRLATNLELLAKGDLNLDLQVSEADKFTEETKNNFVKINNNLEKTKIAIGRLISDAILLSDSAIAGKLEVRADAKAHEGEYRKIVEGVNGTLDAVIEPVQETSAVLHEMSKGNLKVSVNGNYKGDHATLKNSLNDTIETLSGYINDISNALTEIANGNLVISIDREYLGDFAQIKNSLTYIISSLNNVMNDINTAAGQVASGARQVADSSQTLSQGSTEQASSVEQLTASMEQVSVQTKQNATNADEANELALTAKDEAGKGNEYMKGLLDSINDINESASSISKIIKVIDEIAFQTNILALNAAVEAARAGQHGKGFAVVAEEVRNLAARSANAAKETTVLIEGSIKKAEDGTKIASETATALNGIVDVVSNAAKLVGEIATASNEQANGIAQINQGIIQVSQVIQNNTSTSEESAAASEELSSQAELLNGLVGKFKLKKSGSSYDSNQEINPEVIRMLENMNEPKKTYEKKSKKPKISLNDNEFGKY